MMKYEKELIIKASLILASYNNFYEEIKGINKNSYTVNNGVDYSVAIKRSIISSISERN